DGAAAPDRLTAGSLRRGVRDLDRPVPGQLPAGVLPPGAHRGGGTPGGSRSTQGVPVNTAKSNFVVLVLRRVGSEMMTNDQVIVGQPVWKGFNMARAQTPGGGRQARASTARSARPVKTGAKAAARGGPAAGGGRGETAAARRSVTVPLVGVRIPV